MGFKLIQEETLTDLADAIRGKTGYTGPMSPSKMISEVNNFKPEWSVSDLNIAFDEYSAPTNTNKLWVKSKVPDNFEITDSVPLTTNGITVSNTKIPYSISSCGIAQKDGKIYLVGGVTAGSSATIRDTILEYNPITSKYSIIGYLPEPLANTTCFVYDNYLYIIGGDYEAHRQETTSLYKYNLNTNTIDKEIDLRISGEYVSDAARTQGHAVFVGDYVYIVGGRIWRGGYSGTKAGYSIQKYNPRDDTFETMNYSLASPAQRAACIVYDKYIYLFGGGDDFYNYRYVQRIDTEFGTIESLGNILPHYMGDMSAFLYGDDVYLFGGHSYHGSYEPDEKAFDKVWKFNINTGEITETEYKLPMPVFRMASIKIDDTAYFFGGITSADSYDWDRSNKSNTMFTFSSNISVPYNKMIMYVDSSSNTKSHKIIDATNLSMSIKIANTYLGNSKNIGEKLDVFYYDGSNWTLV